MAYEILSKYAPESTQALIEALEGGTLTHAVLSDISAKIAVEMCEAMRYSVATGELAQVADDLVSVLGQNYDLVGECFKVIQDKAYELAGIGMSASKATVSSERLQKIATRMRESEPLANVIIDKDISSVARQAYGDNVALNADKANDAGIKTFINRKLGSGKNCKWCKDLAGTYEYGVDIKSGDNVFRRHDNCNCTIESICDKTVTNAHSKKSYQLSESEAKELEKQQLNAELPQAEAAEKSVLDEIFGLTEGKE